MDAARLVNRLYDALNVKNLNAAMAFFADNAVVVAGDARFTEKDQIRAAMEHSIQQHDWYAVKDFQVSDNRATWVAEIRTGDTHFDMKLEGVIENGQFITFTYL